MLDVTVVYRSFGGGPEAGRRMIEGVADVAAEVGWRFDFATAPHARTLHAHRLLHLALAEGGPVLQGRLEEALLSAYFEHATSMGDAAALRQVAIDVAADLAEARARGVTGVPFFLVDRRLAVSGAQPVAVLEQLLAQASELAA